jgi:hypothetical protein
MSEVLSARAQQLRRAAAAGGPRRAPHRRRSARQPVAASARGAQLRPTPGLTRAQPSKQRPHLAHEQYAAHHRAAASGAGTPQHRLVGRRREARPTRAAAVCVEPVYSWRPCWALLLLLLLPIYLPVVELLLFLSCCGGNARRPNAEGLELQHGDGPGGHRRGQDQRAPGAAHARRHWLAGHCRPIFLYGRVLRARHRHPTPGGGPGAPLHLR